MTPRGQGRSRGRRTLGAVLYWLAVVVVALAIAVGFIAFLVARDDGSVDAGATPSNRANTMIRRA